jgi:hypothetical protein
MHVTGFNFVRVRFSVVSVRLNYQLSVSIFVFSFLGLLISIPSYRYVSLSVSKLRSLERGGVSELSQAQVDR